MASIGDGVAYLTVAEHESDVYIMDLVIRSSATPAHIGLILLVLGHAELM